MTIICSVNRESIIIIAYSDDSMSLPFNEKCAVNSNETLGRYIIAIEDIQPGEVILIEDPLIVSPSWDSSPRCANCFRDSFTICKSCNVFPLCLKCPSHKNFDCTFVKKENLPANFLIDNFSIFGPLMILLNMENDETRDRYEKLVDMESHVEKRKDSDIWKLHEQNVVNPLLIQLNGSFKHHKLDAEFLQKICGIFDINSFEVRGPDGCDILRAIYPNAALLAHSCLANTIISVDESYRMKIYATVPIKKDEIVSYNYTSPLMGTADRQNQLTLGKYFTCECKRCKDPTELGTHLSSITCAICKGLLIQSARDVWCCTNCSNEVENSTIKHLISAINSEVIDAEDDLRLMELLIAKYSSILNPNHYIIIDLKQNVAAVLRNICMNAVCKPGKKVLERKIQLCNEMIPVLSIVEPGISRLTGIALYEKFIPFLELTKMEYDDLEIRDSDYLDRLMQAESILKTAIRMLIYEQVQTAEGRLVQSALQELNDLRKLIASVEIKLKEIN